MRIFITAGEESGDILGGDLLKSLKELGGSTLDIKGIGGRRMEAEGLNSLFPMHELSLMGLAEILPKIPRLQRRIKQTAEAIAEFKPDIILTIDSPDFNFRVIKHLPESCREDAFKVHYVAPTVWAWRPKRARKVARLYDGIMCLLPFEPPYFQKEGMEAVFVGHPMTRILQNHNVKRFQEKYQLDPSFTCFGVLFGSRVSEIKRMGTVLQKSLEPLVTEIPHACVIAPTLPHLEAHVREIVRSFECPVIITSSPDDKADALKNCQIAAATSGTVGLELAVLGVPHVIGYKMNRLSYEIIKRLATTRYAHLGNIILNRPIIPEFIQHDCTPSNIAQALHHLHTRREERDKQCQAFNEIRNLIGGNRPESPSEIAANFILKQLSQR
jgi:lipid-A-disaccharide synthase